MPAALSTVTRGEHFPKVLSRQVIDSKLLEKKNANGNYHLTTKLSVYLAIRMALLARTTFLFAPTINLISLLLKIKSGQKSSQIHVESAHVVSPKKVLLNVHKLKNYLT